MAEYDGALVFTDQSDGSGLLEFRAATVRGWKSVSELKVWTGARWEPKPLLRFNGLAWEGATIKVWVEMPAPL